MSWLSSRASPRAASVSVPQTFRAAQFRAVFNDCLNTGPRMLCGLAFEPVVSSDVIGGEVRATRRIYGAAAMFTAGCRSPLKGGWRLPAGLPPYDIRTHP